jgi:HPt (histidine-containing phosphotransfer) domain-containing protein
MAHSLKGAAGNVSAVDIASVSKALEAAGAKQDEKAISRLLLTLEDKLAQLEEAIGKMRLSDAALMQLGRKDGDFEREGILELLQRLDRSLEECNPVDSEDCLNAVRACSSLHGFREQLKGLEQNVVSYNFDSARQVLSHLTGELRSFFQLGE